MENCRYTMSQIQRSSENNVTEKIETVDNVRKKAMNAFWSLRNQSAKYFPEGMSLDQINEEIYGAEKEG